MTSTLATLDVGQYSNSGACQVGGPQLDQDRTSGTNGAIVFPFEIKRRLFLGNVSAFPSAFEIQRRLAQFGHPTDRAEWV